MSQKGFGTRLELFGGTRIVLGTFGGARIVLGNFGIFLERKTGNVLEKPEMLWLHFADENH